MLAVYNIFSITIIYQFYALYQLSQLYMSKTPFPISSLTTSTQTSNIEPQLITTQVVENGHIVQKCTIGKYQYSKKDFLGEGFSSNVYKATLINNKKQRFAIKVIDLSKFETSQKQLLQSEIDIIRSLNHDNIIKCLDVYKTDANYFLVTEYCPHGDLSQLIQLQKYITEDRAIEIMKQILNGYKYLVSKNVIHRDLKPANVMRFGSQWKIGDFGFSRYCKEDYILEKIYMGTPTYMPPQSLQLNKYSYRSDIFALGIIFYEMLTGSTPWPAKDQRQLLDSMKQNQIQIPRFLVSEQSRTFLEKSIVLDYYERMSKEEFKKFTFDFVDMEKVIKLKPRGVTPCLKRELSNSGKKSFLFATPSKFAKNSFFMPIIKQDVETKKSFNYQKRALELSKPLFAEQQTGQSSPVTAKSFKENTDVINHEIEFVKMLISLVHNCEILGFRPEEEASLGLLIYNIGLKMLKMVGNKRQNYYRLTKWDVFRESDKYRNCTSMIVTYANKFETEYQNFKSKLGQGIIQKFDSDYPELAGNGSLNFRVYSKLFEKLSSFMVKNLVGTNQEQQISEDLLGKKCYALRQIIDMLSTIKYRSRRQQEVKGYGLKVKTECLSLKNVVWSQEALRLTLKQLQTLCKCKIQKE